MFEFCLRNTYFLFQGRYYEQLEGAARVTHKLHISQSVTKNFEVKALSTSTYPPCLWKRHVDKTFVVVKTGHKSGFLEHINSIA